MRLGQIRFDNKITAAVFDDNRARPIPGYSTVDLIRKAETEQVALTALASEMASHHPESAVPLLPIHPVEVWACGCTYETSATFRDEQHGQITGIYAYVCRSERPEIFFKGTARTCVGPGQPIGIRFDSKFTAPEPELGVVLGRNGNVVGYTLGNDVSAWDIERENPLYLPQSKVYTGACALGPVIVTTDDLPDVHKLEMTCTITRGNEVRFSGNISIGRLRRSIDELIKYLLRANPVPAGSVMLTGTGIIVPEDAALAPGDVVRIRIPDIGELANPAAVVE